MFFDKIGLDRTVVSIPHCGCGDLGSIPSLDTVYVIFYFRHSARRIAAAVRMSLLHVCLCLLLRILYHDQEYSSFTFVARLPTDNNTKKEMVS